LAFGCLQFAQCKENNICEKATGEFEKKYERIGFLGFLKSRTKPNRTETGLFDSVSDFFKKKLVWLFFISKNRTEPKMITSRPSYVRVRL
jgi:hypothetical protein